MTLLRTSAELRDVHEMLVVRKPRASDAIGSSLRNIYDPDPRLPADLASLLRHLDAPRRG